MARDEAYREAERLIRQAWQSGSTKLNLSNLGLTDIPSAIAQLLRLKWLAISSNQIVEIPAVIGQLSQLEWLFLSSNQIAEIPAAIGQLSQLRGLHLSSNQIAEIPAAIGQLSQLRGLILSDNQIAEIPAAIGQLPQLRELILSNNKIIEIPAAIGQLSQLQRLNLSKNQIAEIPAAIGQLSQLQELDIGVNKIAKIPAVIGQLSQLQRFYCSRNKIAEIPAVIGQLFQLQVLYLSWNKIAKIPAVVGQLSQLQRLYFRHNKIAEIPAVIGQLTQLHQLGLSSNKIAEIPAVIGQLNQLQNLDIDGNPLNPELSAAYEQGTEALLAYLRAKVEATITLNEAKLILVGEGEVGKSCLLSALRGEAFVPSRSTTHGVEIKTVVATDPDSGREIVLNGWDFGGQPVYRPTHQLFFSEPAVYLVVWKPREGPQQGFIAEWIELIKSRSPKAKILIVATHGGPNQRQPDLDRYEISNQFGSETILDFFHIDSKPNEETRQPVGIEALKAAIAGVAARLPDVGREVPAKWQRVREALQATEQPYLSYRDVLTLCEDNGLNEDQANLFLRISHTLGHLIHYDYDPTLREIVILKPDWLAKAISFVLDDKETRDRNGLVEFERLSRLWRDPPAAGETGYPEDLHPVFLRLMERFDLSYQVVLDPSQPSNTSLIAQLVPDTRPEQLPDWGDAPAAGDREQVQICQIVDEERGKSAKAEGLFYQLIVRLHKYSLGRDNYEKSIHWQRGLMLDDDYNGRALLEQLGSNIRITVRAAYPEFFLYELTKEVQSLVNSFWKGLRCEVMVPCLAPCGTHKPGTGLFSVQKLKESRKKGRNEYPCRVSGCDEWQCIDRLLYNAPTAQPATQTLRQEDLAEVRDELQRIRQTLVVKDRRDRDRFQVLNANQRRIMSQTEKQLTSLLQTLIDEAKDGPRLFSFKPVDPGFCDRPKWMSAKFQLTLWCEHARQPLPVLNPDDPKTGVYHLTLPRKWLVKSAPFLKTVATTLSLFLPVAALATQLALDDTTYNGIQEELKLGENSLMFASRGGKEAIAWTNQSDAPHWETGKVVQGSGSILRELHALLRQKDPSFGGLIRVQNKRREFLWVHPQFVGEY